MKRRTDPLKIILGSFAVLALLAGLWHAAGLRAKNRELRDRIAKYENASVPAIPKSESPTEDKRPRVLLDEARETLFAELSAVKGKRVWFVRQANDPEVDLFQHELENTFLESGWEIAGSSESTNSLRTGLRVFIADDELADHVSFAVNGLRAAGLEVFAGTGYRAFYERQKEKDPNFSGVELAPEQDFVIVVGPNPPPP